MKNDGTTSYCGRCIVEEFDGKRVEVWLDDDDVEWLEERKMFLVGSSMEKPWVRVANGIVRPPIRVEMDVTQVMHDATYTPSNSDSEYDFTYHSEMMDVREVEIRATRNGKLEGIMIKHLIRPDLHGREIWDFRDELIDVDNVDYEEMQYFLGNRKCRRQYESMLPVLTTVMNFLREEKRNEEEFKKLVKSMVGREVEDSEVDEAIRSFKTKRFGTSDERKWKRGISNFKDDGRTALRQILKMLEKDSGKA